jgi:protoheme IX farnesyltransferase
LGTTGLAYSLAAAILDGIFLYYAWRVFRVREGAEAEHACRKLFSFSILWLFLIFAAIMAEKIAGLPAFAPLLG